MEPQKTTLDQLCRGTQEGEGEKRRRKKEPPPKKNPLIVCLKEEKASFENGMYLVILLETMGRGREIEDTSDIHQSCLKAEPHTILPDVVEFNCLDKHVPGSSHRPTDNRMHTDQAHLVQQLPILCQR